MNLAATHALPPEATLDFCIKCNICVTACPVAAVTDKFPGPKYEGPQAARFRHADQDVPDRSVDYCSGCRVCNMVCPTGVRIAEINARARARMVEAGLIDNRDRVRNNLLARPATLARLGGPFGPIINRAFSNELTRSLTERLVGIHRSAPLPKWAGQRFSRWFEGRATPTEHPRGRVAFFTGCSAEHYESRVAAAAVQVLEALGFEVVIPEQGCCGLPLLSNGEFDTARSYHDANVATLIGLVRQGVPIVGTSTSCTLTLKEEAPELLDSYGDDHRAVAANTYDIHEFLAELVEIEPEAFDDLRPVDLELIYHPPCQYRAHRVGLPALDVMQRIPSLSIIESGAACCGIAGTYGYKAEKYEIAMLVGEPLFRRVRDVGGPVAVCDSETCRWQIEHATGVPSIHPIELLAVSLGIDASGPLADALSM